MGGNCVPFVSISVGVPFHSPLLSEQGGALARVEDVIGSRGRKGRELILHFLSGVVLSTG